ncbi:24725_t:CDS:10 [Entrophospora sp. SA101]|nr:24725_t:CDS:10 [Entrophospora sp. SA101]
MGIQGLIKVIGDNCPAAITSNEIKNYFGRKVAIDASISIYQFLIAVRQQDGQQLTTEAGETTSHLMGLFYRTIRMVENGIKPCYVFDGKSPVLKSGQLAKRLERRKEANRNLDEALETVDDIDKFSRRTVKVTPQHNDECKQLLRLMGIPYVEAPYEAEAQCAALAKAGKVYAAASEDMDTLTFSSPILLRHLTFSESRKLPIDEINLNKVIEGLEVSMDQGIGPHRAVELIKKHGSLEEIIENLDPKRYTIPEDWPYKEVRELFKKPVVKDPNEIEIKWETPDVEGIVDFLVHQKNFSEERVRKSVAKLAKNIKATTQLRMENYFTPSTNKKSSTKHKKSKTSTNKKSITTKLSGARGRPKK